MSRFSDLSNLPDDLDCCAFGAAVYEDRQCREFARATTPTKEEITLSTRAIDEFVFQTQDHTAVGVSKYACKEDGSPLEEAAAASSAAGSEYKITLPDGTSVLTTLRLAC